jgi:hypothetical protein
VSPNINYELFGTTKLRVLLFNLMSYTNKFSVDELTACTLDSDCRTKTPWALDGCNWVVAGAKSGLYCTGLRECTPTQTFTQNNYCALDASARGIGGAKCLSRSAATNVPAGFTGTALCQGTAGASPITPTETVRALADKVQQGVPFLAGCYEVYHDPNAPDNALDLKTADPTACAATDALFVGLPSAIQGMGFSDKGKIASDATPSASTSLATPTIGTQWACLETPAPAIAASSIKPYCVAGADGRCIGSDLPTKPCGSAVLPPAFGPDMPSLTTPAVGDHVWILEGVGQ